MCYVVDVNDSIIYIMDLAYIFYIPILWMHSSVTLGVVSYLTQQPTSLPSFVRRYGKYSYYNEKFACILYYMYYFDRVKVWIHVIYCVSSIRTKSMTISCPLCDLRP